ncbi:hypothetical protein [Methylobacterium nodulans]|uniref:TonB C-terminal domain-containing protein n=1 Tax=Methylobacterium nodulans (strain LMG 21967 / CNCM I-2342 / ORS 2060) TaxID=460265 RepID=B8IVK3_METNO|nr:hypothetical protein [Methylobacterium nodulans]ACL62443.1 conserved hypothetical protein [Methylobacterium nodulans ORS 2060]
MRAIMFALLVIFVAENGTVAAAANQSSTYSKKFIAFFFEIRRYNDISSEITEEVIKDSDDAHVSQKTNRAASAFDVCDMDDFNNFKRHISSRDNRYIREFNLAGNPDDTSYIGASVVYVKQLLININKLARKRSYKIGAAIAYLQLDTEGVVLEARVIDFLGDTTIIREVYGVVTPGRKLGEPPYFVDKDNLKFIVPVVFER